MALDFTIDIPDYTTLENQFIQEDVLTAIEVAFDGHEIPLDVLQYFHKSFVDGDTLTENDLIFDNQIDDKLLLITVYLFMATALFRYENTTLLMGLDNGKLKYYFEHLPTCRDFKIQEDLRRQIVIEALIGVNKKLTDYRRDKCINFIRSKNFKLKNLVGYAAINDSAELVNFCRFMAGNTNISPVNKTVIKIAEYFNAPVRKAILYQCIDAARYDCLFDEFRNFENSLGISDNYSVEVFYKYVFALLIYREVVA